MKAQSLYIFAAIFLVSGILLFLKGFFLTRVELPAKSIDSLDIYGAFNGIKQSTELSQRFLSKSVLDLGHSIHSTTQNSSIILQNPYFSLFNAIGDDTHMIKTKDTSTTAISPIALLSTIHSMPNSVEQLFTPSKTHSGFIPQDNPIQQTCSWFCRQYDQIFFIVVDALRFDFLQYNQTLSPDFGKPPEISFNTPPYVNRLSNLARFHEKNPTNSNFYKFRADAPTVTMQRLKALLTGSLPTFLDVKDNFSATSIQEDNLMYQIHGKKHHTVMVGDDTWMGLVGSLLTRPYPYPSFDVHDLDTVDNGCIYRIHHELCGRTLASMKLGLDEYFQQFLYDDKFDTGNNPQELDQLRKDAKELQQYIDSTLHFEQDSLLSQSYIQSLNKDSTLVNKATDFSIPNEISYANITTTPNWFIAHFLGVDHVGHRFGPRHPLMDTKLRQMNEILLQFLQYIDVYSDHTSHHTKPFLSIFQEQYDFVLEHCDKATTDPFSQKLTSIKHLVKKETQLNVAQFSTKSPLPRVVVYILGDHGMTEGGNHGGASLKEIQAGFGVFSSLTLDSPSSYIKHQQLHNQTTKLLSQFGTPHSMISRQYKGISDIFQHLSNSLGQSNPPSPNIKIITSNHNTLPPLTLVYDYSHIKNYDDVYTQTKVQSAQDEAFSMGQIDALPTLSLIAGIPIPYGNLGVLKKELIPNQFVHQHHGRLSGMYSDDWTNFEQICSIFSTFNNNDDKIHIKIAELRHEIMILHLRVLNLGQVLRYSKDYIDTVKSFSGSFIHSSFIHTRVIWAKLAMIEDSITFLSTACQTQSNKNSVATLGKILHTLYPAIIDTNQHIHLVLTHIKAGYTREWTQFDMVSIYSALIVFGLLTVVVALQFFRYILHARKNHALQSTHSDVDSHTTPPGSHWIDRDDRNESSVFHSISAICSPCCDHTFTKTTSFFELLQYLIIYTTITTITIVILPIILFISTTNYTDILIPIPSIFTRFNEITSGGNADETPAALAKAVTTTQTTTNTNVYTMEISSFIIVIFLIIFIIYFTLYQVNQFRNTWKRVQQSQRHTRTALVEQHTWNKFFVTFAIIVGLIIGLFTNVFIDSGMVIHQSLCTFLTAWTLFSINGSLRYYYFESSRTYSAKSAGHDDLDDIDYTIDESIGLTDHSSETDDYETDDYVQDFDNELSQRSLVPRERSRSYDDKSPPTAISQHNFTQSKSRLRQLPLNSPFLIKHTLSPCQFLYFSIIAFICIAIMTMEDELTRTNAKLLFNIPFKDHGTLVSSYQDLMNGGVASALTTIFTNADDVIAGMASIDLTTERQIKADMVNKPKLMNAIVHQNDGDNHKNDQHDNTSHDTNHDNTTNDLTTDNDNDEDDRVFVEPDLAGKIDLSQVSKTALNMFSPDISLDGAYVRKESNVILIVRDINTGHVINGAGQLHKETYYQDNKIDIHNDLTKKYANRGRYGEVTIDPIIASFPGTALDTRSHFSSIHIIIVLTLFFTGLHILCKNIFLSYPNSHNNADQNITFPHYIQLFHRFSMPLSAFFVICYWLPNYIALFTQPLVQLFLTLFGTCNNLFNHNLLLNPLAYPNTILSQNDQLQLCATDSESSRPIFVQILRLYIPSLVYVAFFVGLILFAMYLYKYIEFQSNQELFKHVNDKTTYSSMLQYYSSQQLLTFLFIILYPTVCLVSGPRGTVVYALYIIFLDISKRLIQTMFIIIPYNKQLVHLTNFSALFAFITILMFHASGHAYSFNDIHIASGFVGIPGYIFGVSEALVFFNTFGGFFFGIFGCLIFGYYTTTFYEQYLEHSSKETADNIQLDTHLQLTNQSHTQYFLSFSRIIPIAWFILWTAVRLFLCTVNVVVKRRDLFVWGTFAPYWLIIAIMTLIIYSIAILYAFTLPTEHHRK